MSWREVRVSEVVGQAFSGPSPTCEERNVRGAEWGVLKTTCATWDFGWDPTKHKVLPPEYWGKAHLEVHPGDCIVTKAGPRHRVGVSAFVRSVPSRIVPSGKMICLRPLRGRIEPGFLAIALADRRTQAYLDQRTTGMAESQVNFENADLLSAPIWLPSLDLQRQILNKLEDTDELISAFERRLAKNRAITLGIAQRLLSGRTRLPGFAQPWTEAALSEVATVDPEALAGTTDRRAEIEYISLEDVARGQILGYARVAFGGAPSRARRVIREGDVLFGTVRPNLQSHAIYRGGLSRPIASTGFAVVRSDKTRSDAQFLFFLLMSRLTTAQVDRIIAGSNYPAVSSADVRRLTFDFPPIEEQVAIGSVLADCEDEALVLKRSLSKTRDVRTGMMQQLLAERARQPSESGS